jgi:hypothetical protein
MHTSNNYFWWKESDDKIHESVIPYLDHLDRKQSYRSGDNLTFMRLYGNAEILGLQAYQYAKTESSYNVQNRVTMNIVQSMIDTVVSKITKSKPKPTFLTQGGDWSLQRKAKKLTKFIEGQFYASDFYSKATMAFMDSCIFGTGAIKIFKHEGELKAERVFINEIFTDDAESFYGEPRQLHQVKYIHKDVLKEMFPNAKGFIEDANSTDRKSVV